MTLTFAPYFSLTLTIAMALIALALAGFGLWRRMRGAWLRALALALVVLALANPSFVSENREPLSTVVAIVVDRSQSQLLPERQKQTDAALEDLKTRLSKFPGIEPRIVEVRDDGQTEAPSTRAFAALTSALSDVAPSRVGGAVFITDGQIHDIPEAGKLPGFNAPVHALITGRPNEFDRRIEVVRAPRFSLVNSAQELTFRVVDDGGPINSPAIVTIRINGEEAGELQATPGQDTRFDFKLTRAGSNVVDFEVAKAPGELTTSNNQAVQLIDGIRQNLRVLLVSGEPHAGERAWRNLLKSDALVDLVHFTILRPPEKQDGTPINELSLIAFPTRELFVDKIKEFDLIILDRYQNRGVLPVLYYDNIAQYVKKGGALLVAAGPEYAGENSIADTPLTSVLPAIPTGEIDEKGFYPRLSDLGKKHPVTRGLEGADSEPPHWSRWFRTVDVDQPEGNTVMVGADKKPLLVLNRSGEGRVALLLSDEGWLWSRGFEGGGPSASLYRRIAYWLMKEPALEEEALTARSSGRDLEIIRQTIGGDPGEAMVTYPSGKTQQVALKQSEPGLYKATLPVGETGLFKVANGDFSALAHVGAVDAPEFKSEISTTETLKPMAEATHGVVARLAKADGTAEPLPQILAVNGNVQIEGNSRMAFRLTNETVLKGINSFPLFNGILGLAALLFAASSMWWREGR
jgi:hypothetical protein